jgi:hypothetical protein
MILPRSQHDLANMLPKSCHDLGGSCQDPIMILAKILSQSWQDSIIILPWSWKILSRSEDLTMILPWSQHDLANILSILILEVLDTISCHDFTMIIPKMPWFWKILVKGGFYAHRLLSYHCVPDRNDWNEIN